MMLLSRYIVLLCKGGAEADWGKGFFSRERVTEPDGHTTIMYWRVKHL